MQKKKKDMQSGGFTPGPSSRRFEQQTDPNKQPVTNTLGVLDLTPDDTRISFPSLDIAAFQENIRNREQNVQENIDFFISPDEDNVPKDFLPENAPIFGPIRSRGTETSPQAEANTPYQQKAIELFRKGKVRTVEGEIVNIQDIADEASFLDRLMGRDINGYKPRRTYDYSPTSIFNPSQFEKYTDEELRLRGYTESHIESKRLEAAYRELFPDAYSQRLQEERENNILDRIFGSSYAGKNVDPYAYRGFYPVYDEESGDFILQESKTLDEEEFRRIGGALMNAHGPSVMAKSALQAFNDGFSHTLGGLVPDLLNFAELTTDLAEAGYNKFFGTGDWDSNPDGWTDRVASEARVNTEFNRFSRSAAEQTDDLFASGASFSNGLGSGLASLLSFWGMGSVGSKLFTKGGLFLAKKLGKKFPAKLSSMMGHMAGGMPINAGEIYKQAKLDGLDDDEAATMGLTVGFINTLIEYGFGTNRLANRMMGVRGNNEIYRAIFNFAERTGMKVNSKEFLDKMTGPILKNVFERLERIGAGGITTRLGRGLSSGIEEGTEEIAQGAVIDATKQTYNAYFAPEEATQGAGKFRDDPTQLFDIEQMLGEGAIGFILGAGVRTITNAAYDPDLMSLIAEGKSDRILDKLSNIHAAGNISRYQYNKLKRRVEGMTALWKDNEIAYSYLSPKGQYIAGQSLLLDQNYKEKIESLDKRIAKTRANKNLTRPVRNKTLKKLEAQKKYLENLQSVNNSLLDIMSDPEKARLSDIENIPVSIINGLRTLALGKTKAQLQREQLDELYRKASKSPAAFNKLLKALQKDPQFKDVFEALKVKQADDQQKIDDVYNALSEKYDNIIKQADDKINELLTSPDTWENLQNDINEAKKTTLEKEKENEEPLKKESTSKKKKENFFERRKKAQIEAQQEADAQQRREEAAQKKAESKVFSEMVPEAGPTHIKYGKDKTGRVLNVEVGPNGKKQYILDEKDEEGKNIRVTEGKGVVELVSLSSEADPRHRDNFLDTYWLQVASEEASMNTISRETLERLLTTDPNLRKRIQVEFVNIPRKLSDTHKKNPGMLINMNGSFLIIRDREDGTILGVVRSNNRFYDIDGNLIEGDQMTEEFFVKNFNKVGTFTDEQWKAWGNNYKTLKQTLDQLEKLYPNATLEKPQILDDSLFKFNVSAKITPTPNQQNRISLTNKVVPHTYDGDYIIYDRLEKKIIYGKTPSKKEFAKLPNENTFEGRYFALVKQGEVVEWVRIFPKRVNTKQLKQRLDEVKAEIITLNKQIKEGKYTQKHFTNEINRINKKLNLFIAGSRNLYVNVGVDLDRKTNSYKLSIYGSQRQANGTDQKIIPNVRLRSNVSIKTIIDTINQYITKYEGIAAIDETSFKESIPNDGSEIEPDNFESSMGPGGFANATMSIEVSDDIFKLKVEEAPVEPEGTPVGQGQFFDEDGNPIVLEKPETEGTQQEPTPEKNKTFEDIVDELNKEDRLENIDVNRLNNGVRLDLINQLTAQLIDGPVDPIIYMKKDPKDLPDVTNTINELLDEYIEGITLVSFKTKDIYTPEEAKILKEQMRFARRQKAILNSPDFDRSDIITAVTYNYRYTQQDPDVLDPNYSIAWNEISAIASLPQRVKQFIKTITTPSEDIFGRRTWQSEKYGTKEILKTLDGHAISGHIMKVVSDQIDEGDVMKRLEAAARYDDQLSRVVLAIKANPSIEASFTNAFNKFNLPYIKLLKEKNKAVIIESVQNGPINQILNKWYSRSSNIDPKTKRLAIEEIEAIFNNPASPYTKVESLVNAFDKLGWSIEPAAAAYMLGEQKMKEAFPELEMNEFGNIKTLFRGTLQKLDRYNKKPLSLKQNDKLYKLAKIAAIFDPETYEANYRDAQGKSRYKYVSRNLYMENARKLQEGRMNSLFETKFKNNLLKNKVSGIEIKMAGDFVEGNDTATNKTLTAKQRAVLMFSLFLEEDSEGYAYYTPHVIETKKSLYAIKLPKKIYFDGNITQEAIDDAYKSLFVREFERNLTPEEQLDSTNYFGILSILEKKTITAPNGETMLVKDYLKDRETLDGQEQFIKQNIILPMLQEVVRDLRERVEELGLLDEINKLVVTGPSVGNINSKIGNLAINYLIYGGNYTQLALGDSNFKDDKDFVKRLAGFNAAGLKKGNIGYKYVVIQDDILSEDEAFGQQGVSANDAQVFMTLEMYAVRELESENYQNDSQRKILEKLRDSLDDPDIVVTQGEINQLDLNSTKTVYEDGNRYFKKSDFIITKRMAEKQDVAGNPVLLNIYNALNAQKVMYLITESASKRKTPESLPSNYFSTADDAGQFNNLIQEGEMQYERDQVVNRTKSKYGLETYATQAKQLHDLIGSVVVGDGRAIVEAMNQASADSKNTFYQLINAIVNDPDNIELLKQIIVNNNKGIRNEETLNKLETLSEDLPDVRSLIIQSIVDIFNRDALRSEVVGGQATLASSSFMVNPQTGQPLKIHRNKNGAIEYAEILASRKFFNLNEFTNIKDVPTKLLTAFGVRIPVQTYHSMIPLKVVGFLEDSHGDTIVVPRQIGAVAGSDYDLDKLYLHRYASTVQGNTRVLLDNEPNLQQYKEYWSNHQYVKLAQQVYKIGPTEAMQRLGLLNEEGQAVYTHPQVSHNKMLDNMFEVFNRPEVQEVMFTPATAGQAQTFVDMYGEREVSKSPFTVTGILDYHNENRRSAQGVGISANGNSAYSILTQFGEDMLAKPTGVIFDGKEYKSYTIQKEDDIGSDLNITEGVRSKFDSISSIITLFVDNAKLGLAAQVNLSSDMTTVLLDLIAVGAGQLRSLLFINQPILKYYTKLQETTTIPSNYKGQNYALDLIRAKVKQGNPKKNIDITSSNMDQDIKGPFNIEEILQEGPRTDAEADFLSRQAGILATFKSLIEGPANTTVRELTRVLSTVRGVSQDIVRDGKRRGRLLKTLSDEIALRAAHPVYQNNKKVIYTINDIIDKNFLKRDDVQRVFVDVYGNFSADEAKKLIQEIQELKKNPKYKKNFALHALLQIRNGRLVADSQSKISKELEGQFIGNFEDLFEDNPGLADKLLKYLFATTALGFVNDSFIRYLPASIFTKFSDALKKAKETGVIPKTKPVFIQRAVEEETEFKPPLEKEEVLDPGEYTVEKISEELGIQAFKPLINNLQKAKVKVVYDPTATGASYMQGVITLNSLEKTIFLEEALHAGLDILPAEEKTKLRKDVLAWYKDLLTRHKNDERSKRIQRLFNTYNRRYKDEEKAAEEIITHLIYKDKALIDDLNNLKSRNKEGLDQSMWSKFVNIIAKLFGIDIQKGTELESLATILQPVDRLFTKDYTYTQFSKDRMFNLPAGESSMFSDIVIKTPASNVNKLLLDEEFSQMVFDGDAMPIVESIVNVFEGTLDRGLATIKDKQLVGHFATLSPSQKEALAVQLGYESLTDWKKNGTALEKQYIQGRKTEGMILKLQAFTPQTIEDLNNMRTIDPDRYATNNVLILLNKQLQNLSNAKNSEFVRNRKARLNKLITDIKVSQDVFNSIDDFYDDVKTQAAALDALLSKPRKLTDMIENLTRFRIVLEDMGFIRELPEEFREKLKTTEYKDSEKMLKKLQDAVSTHDAMTRKLRKEFIPVLAKQLYPLIKDSGPETKKYIDTNLKSLNDQIAKLKASNLADKNERIKRAKARINKFTKLAEQAPQSEEDFAKFLMYSAHDMDWFGYMLMAPGTTSDPGLAALVNYSSALAIEARRRGINVANRLEDAENLLKQDRKEKGLGVESNPRKLYDAIIELKNNRGTGNRDVWTLVTKIDASAYDAAQKIEEDKITGNSKLMNELRAQVIKERDTKIDKITKAIETYKQQENQEAVASIISDLEARLQLLQSQKANGVKESEIVRLGLRKRKWFGKNVIPKSIDEIRAIMTRVGTDKKSWARSQMNSIAMFELGIITQEELDIMKVVEKQVYGFESKTPSYFGYQVTRPNDKYINKKWAALYDKNDKPKNKAGEAHQIFTNVYRDALSLVYKKQSVDMQLPSLRRGFLDRILDNTTFEGIKREISRLFTVDEDDAFVYGYAALQGQSRNYAPVYFMDDIAADEVSLDIKSSIMTFYNAALRTEQNNEVLKIAYMLRDVYAQTRVAKPEQSDIIGIQKMGRKVANMKQGQSYVGARLEKYIEMVLLGKTKNIESVNIFGKDIQLDKLIDTMLGYTAITTLGLDFLKGGRNYLTAVWQQGIEAGASRANKGKISVNEFISGHAEMIRETKNLMDDKYKKSGNYSYLGQLLLYFDAIQGNFDDFASGKQTTGRTMIRQTIANPDNLLINYHIGEVLAQGGATIALLRKRKVTLGGNEVSLYDAFTIKDGKFQMIEGTEAEQLAAKEVVRKTVVELSEMNRRLNGNYKTIDKSVLSQSAAGRMLELFRKFLVPTMMNRWRVDFVNHEKGEPDGGFYRRSINNMWNAWKTSAESTLVKKALDTYKRSTLTPQDKESLFKVLNELITLAILSTVLGVVASLQDDDEEEAPVSIYYLMYILQTTRAELLAFTPTPYAVTEMLRILRSPTAMSTGIERTMKLLSQLGAPFEEYERATGPWDKGENKLKVRALQWLGISGTRFDPELALRNFVNIQNR